ncbi:redox-sensitive transcriptional activator SoxR [Vibrio sagamiensis]|uniref:Redox-sensitive transcriptional activator SoxR n=1 Tax=Vibrio sagamiensis NBRC 104589 TaxID=1219064 RepID=A0A511QDB9_9VIBR|nr:redox-sensitive transcriptional activator SoxR [Vibrio sagamiensis]PNQ54546.1 redox-sensitive transcriptional activator SoxR [Vibrio agarivorans]GEM75167.1 redox-sensitive transcriptional activator SoxR [Vibrio sagamiensis NBRC 104589]
MELSIGEVAQRSGVKVSALHFYEKKGLVFSWRSQGNQRQYHRSVLRRVAIIKAAQQVGLSLEEIHKAFESLPKHQAPNKLQWEALSKKWFDQLDKKIHQMQKLQMELGECIGCGCLSLEKCRLRNPDDIEGKQYIGSKLIVTSF